MSKLVTSKLREWRQANDLTQEQAAARLSVTRKTWQSWEMGKSIPDEGMMGALVKMTGGLVEPNDFYPMSIWRAAIARALSAIGIDRDAA